MALPARAKPMTMPAGNVATSRPVGPGPAPPRAPPPPPPRAKSAPFRDGGAPGAGQPAFTFAGLNIAVLWGPSTQGHVPAPPDATKVEAARKLAEALGVLGGA